MSFEPDGAMATALCIAGKNLIAVHALASLSRCFDVVCLPNPADDGSDGWQPSLRRAAVGLGVPITSLQELYERNDLCFLSLEYSEIIKPERFKTDKLFNVHFSLLPKYRGCNTSVWPILRGEAEHGVTLHLIDAGIDTGAIIDQRAFSLDGMTAFDAYMTCQRLGIELALEWTPKLVSGDYVARPQGAGTSFARKTLDFSLKEIDLAEDAEQVLRRVRAFTFPAYQRPTLNGRTIYEASLDPFEGSERMNAADREVYIRFERHGDD